MLPDTSCIMASTMSKIISEPVPFLNNGEPWIAVDGLPMPYGLWIAFMSTILHGVEPKNMISMDTQPINADIVSISHTIREGGGPAPFIVSGSSGVKHAGYLVTMLFSQIRKDADRNARILAMLRRIEDEYASLIMDREQSLSLPVE